MKNKPSRSIANAQKPFLIVVFDWQNSQKQSDGRMNGRTSDCKLKWYLDGWMDGRLYEKSECTTGHTKIWNWEYGLRDHSFALPSLGHCTSNKEVENNPSFRPVQLCIRYPLFKKMSISQNIAWTDSLKIRYYAYTTPQDISPNVATLDSSRNQFYASKG